MTPERRFIQLRANLMRISPFFSTLLLHTPYSFTTDIPTFAVSSHNTLLINPDFSLTLSDKHYLSIVCHEILHLALNQIHRAHPLLNSHPTLDCVKILNIAADIIVNTIILDYSYNFELPPGSITEQTYAQLIGVDCDLDESLGGTKGLGLKSLPYVFKRVLSDVESDPSLQDQVVNVCISGDKPSTSPPNDLLEIAKSAQLLSGKKEHAFFRSLDLVCPPSPTPYQELLARFVSLSDFTWDDVYDRRFIHQHTYIDVPSSPTLNLGIFIDVSGSINEPVLRMFLSELHSNLLLSRWAKVNITAYFFDTELHEPPIHSIEEILALKSLPGGGGTDFACWKKIDNATAYVIYSDLEEHNILQRKDLENYLYETLESNNFLWVVPPESNPETKVPGLVANLVSE